MVTGVNVYSWDLESVQFTGQVPVCRSLVMGPYRLDFDSDMSLYGYTNVDTSRTYTFLGLWFLHLVYSVFIINYYYYYYYYNSLLHFFY